MQAWSMKSLATDDKLSSHPISPSWSLGGGAENCNLLIRPCFFLVTSPDPEAM